MSTTVSIHALGSLELLDHRRHPVTGAAVQPKRVALQLFDPADESTIRRLIELLHRTGNSAAAFREFDTFACRLRDLYGVDPSPETYELVGRVRGL